MKKFSLLLVLALVLVIQFSAAEVVKVELGTDQEREAGKAFYDKNCAQCHGAHGDGNGVARHFLKPWPRNFTRGVFKFKSITADKLPTTEDIKRVIRDGNPGTGMPPWPDFSDSELTDLAYYIKSFSEDFVDEDTPEDEDIAPVPYDFKSGPFFSEESVEKGALLFIENKCVDCHGGLGRGSGSSAPEQVDVDENHIYPRDMSKRWLFRNGSTRDDVFRTITTGISPMPNYENLTEEQ